MRAGINFSSKCGGEEGRKQSNSDPARLRLLSVAGVTYEPSFSAYALIGKHKYKR